MTNIRITGDVIVICLVSVFKVCTQGEREQQQAEAGEVQCRLLVDLGHCIERDTEQQRGSREPWTAQERQQDGTHYEVACMRDTRPHGCQAQTCNHKKRKGNCLFFLLTNYSVYYKTHKSIQSLHLRCWKQRIFDIFD